MPRKILFIVAHRPGRSPGQRFRFEQYLSFLEENGFEYEFSYLISEADDKIFYSKGKYVHKLLILIKSLWIRFQDIKKAHRFDLIFIYREAVMLGTTWFERQLEKTGKKIILDFDDAIWLMDISEGNKNLKWLKKPEKTEEIIKLSHLVIVGNDYLASYARNYNAQVAVIPTTIDTGYYVPKNGSYPAKPVCIGWTGTSTTLKHLKGALPILSDLKQKYSDLTFCIISDEPLISDLKDVENIRWNKATEISDLHKIDIGIMPLPDDQWANGKCGFKGLQYMALEIPTVMSPVGVNTEIIQEGRNGFLASTHEDWVEKLSLLIENAELRKTLGVNGRKTVIERFSFESQKNRYLELLNQVYEL